MLSMYIKWLIFSCDLLSLYPAVHFLSMWLSGIIIIIIIYSLEFFSSVLTDGLLLEFEWQQVSSSLQDFSQYSDSS